MKDCFKGILQGEDWDSIHRVSPLTPASDFFKGFTEEEAQALIDLANALYEAHTVFPA